MRSSAIVSLACLGWVAILAAQDADEARLREHALKSRSFSEVIYYLVRYRTSEAAPQVQARLQQFAPIEIADSLLRWDDRRRASRVDQAVTTTRSLLSGTEIRAILAPRLRAGGLSSLLRESGDRITPPSSVLPIKGDARIPGFETQAIEPCSASVQPRGGGFTILVSMEAPGCWVYINQLLMPVGSTLLLPSAVPQGVHVFGWDFTAGARLEIRDDGLMVLGKAVLQILRDTTQ